MSAEGHALKEIAARMGLSIKTISVHRDHCYRKLGVSNAVELVRKLMVLQGPGIVDLKVCWCCPVYRALHGEPPG